MGPHDSVLSTGIYLLGQQENHKDISSHDWKVQIFYIFLFYGLLITTAVYFMPDVLCAFSHLFLTTLHGKYFYGYLQIKK